LTETGGPGMVRPQGRRQTMRRRWIAVGLLALAAGCNRQDAECLGRIGTLVGQRLEKLKPAKAADAGLPASLPGYGPADPPAEGDAGAK
jgi:hypothetical protein